MSYAWVDVGEGRKVYRKIDDYQPKRASLSCPMLNLDTMDPVQSMATGQWHTSKSAIRAEYKRLGMVEVGNDPARLRKPKKPKIDDAVIADTIDRAEARFKRGERVSKA